MHGCDKVKYTLNFFPIKPCKMSKRISGGAELLGMVDAFVFDCDGVIWKGDCMIDR